MTTTLREMLARRANDAGSPNLDIQELIGLGEARLRRRRIAAAVGSAAAAVVVLAFVFGAALHSPVKRGDGPPVTRPSPSPTQPPAPPVRQLLYIDVPLTGREHNRGVIHYGDRAIESQTAFVHTDVTDDGFVYTTKDEAWFSDGGTPEQIGSQLCELRAIRNGGMLHMAQGAVMTGAAGSLAAWFECPDPEPPTLVVYDTGSGREVARLPVPFCPGEYGCHLDNILGEHIYFTRFEFGPGVALMHHVSYDVATGRLATAGTSRAYAEDVRSHSRGLVVGDTWQTATPADQLLAFHAVGTRLVAWFRFNPDRDPVPTTAFDTATHQALQLRLPPGYHADEANFILFEWLDDNTVALKPDRNLQPADILTCRLSEGRCRLTVKEEPDGVARIVPQRSLPG